MDEKVKVFLAFQGGGARGISHVGGLRAVQERGMEIRGVAGTSAGAILAALVASGYTHEELFDGADGKQLLQTVADGKYSNPTRLFTKLGWWSIRCSQGFFKLIRLIFRIPTCILVLSALSALVGIGWLDFEFSLRTYIVSLVIVALIAAIVGIIYLGLAPLREIRHVVDRAIADKLKLSPNVTFRQLYDATGRQLKLVATNVSKRSLQLFTAKRTPDTVIADAVTASICLPFIFRSCAFDVVDSGTSSGRCRFLDGGLLSNLPMWTFDEQRDLDKGAITIAFGLKSSKGSGNWLLAAIDTIVAGPPQIHARGIRNLVQIDLPSNINLLQFDAGFEVFNKEIEASHQEAANNLDEQVEYPQLIMTCFELMEDSINKAINETFLVTTTWRIQAGSLPALRFSLFIQKQWNEESLHVAFEYGHQESSRGAALHLEQSIPGRAWQEREALEAGSAIVFQGTTGPNWLYEDSEWLVAVPIPLLQADENKLEIVKNEARLESRAVVLVIDSTTPLSADALQAGIILTTLNETCRANAIQVAEEYDLGRAARSAQLWL